MNESSGSRGDRPTPHAFYRRWIVANGWSEALGLGTTFLVGRAAAPWLAASRPAGVLLSGVAAVVLGTLLEGTVVGAAQARVVGDALPGLRRRGWVCATMLGAGAAWLLGMVPSTVMAFASADQAGTPLGEPPALVQYGLAALLGLVAGPVLGSAQWLVLRRHRRRAGLWLWANAFAWAVGMPLIFLGMELVPWEQGGIAAAAAIYAVCGVAGLAVGAIHGRMLLRLVSARPEVPALGSARCVPPPAAGCGPAGLQPDGVTGRQDSNRMGTAAGSDCGL